MSVDAWLDRPVADIAEGVRTGSVKAAELVDASLARIAHRDGDLNAVVSTHEAHARERARAVDDAVARGEDPGALAGVPALVKDNLCTTWADTTCASRMLAGYRSPFTATCVEKLEGAGAVVVGSANMDEFAMGGSGEHSCYGPTRNPLDPSRVPGGSSSGSAAAVAAGMVPLSLGSDTGGSVRQPASFCGVVGVKPTYGRVSRWGLVAFASSLDQVGVLARDARGAALGLSAIEGHDEKDMTSARAEASGCARGMDVAGLRVGVVRHLLDGVEAEVATAFDRACAALEGAGVELVDVEMRSVEGAVSAYYVLAPAEASSNLARYDGVRYGRRTEVTPGMSVGEMIARSRGEGFGDEVQRRIVIGTFVLSAGYHDAYYTTAQRVRRLVKNDYERIFAEGCSAVLTPTAPTRAFALGAFDADPLAMYLQDAFTIPANLAGLPSVSAPCPGVDGVSAGALLTGRAFDERTIMALAGTLG
ncbi:MAG: Asp-tRNA(Asn)/Glu-tRNA(Gln) amidotransferase subunit GatA [Phycisphaerales bacterium]